MRAAVIGSVCVPVVNVQARSQGGSDDPPNSAGSTF